MPNATPLPTLSPLGVRFVKRVYEAFSPNAQWPPELELRRAFAQDDELDVFRAGVDLGDWFVLFHADGRNGVALHLASVAAAYPDNQVTTDFALLLQLAIARWNERGAPPRLDDGDLDRAGLTRERMKYLNQFFEKNIFLTGPSGNDAGYSYDISVGIEPYLHVKTLREFLAILWRERYGTPDSVGDPKVESRQESRAQDPARSYGQWRRIETLGTGGNATVYRAIRDGEQEEVALKVLHSQRVQSEPYRRFVQEVGVLRELGSFQGILPLIDSHLPKAPKAADPAWLSMPIATPLDKALAQEPLERVVEAIAVVAETLARLARRDISHRDLKPGNLYSRDGNWLIGDFGLVAVPNGDAITENDKKLGPQHFIAYEMVVHAASADPKAADVYSLAKTLWVLAVNRKFPPGGHQSSTEDGLRITDLKPERRADLLDEVVDRATLLKPESRPSMEAVANDLRSWLQIRVTPRRTGGVVLDVGDLVAPFRAKLKAEIDAEDTEAELARLGEGAGNRLEQLAAPLDDALQTLDGRAELDRFDHNFGGVLHNLDTLGSPRSLYRKTHVSSIRSGPEYFPFAVTYGWGIDVDEAGLATIRTLVYVGHEEVMGSDYWWQGEARQADVGSVELARLSEEVVTELGPKLREALEAYEKKLG